MSQRLQRYAVYLLAVSMLRMAAVQAAPESPAIHVFVNDSCIVADEPYFIPAVSKDGSDVMTPKFLPLIGLVIGKLVEMFITSEMNGGANKIKANAARKDTRYALTEQMNLYRADLKTTPTLAINAKLGCMTILAANLKAPPANCTADYVPKTLAAESMQVPTEQWKTSRTDNSVENQLRRANICVDGKLAAVYEARFEFSDDGTAYRLKDAGYHINTLLTTQDRGAKRDVVYTLKVSQPGATDQQELLSSAYVKLGTLSAGAQSAGVSTAAAAATRTSGANDPSPWLRVPALSAEARRAFDVKTHAHQEVTGEIEALKRAMTRNQRVIDGIDQRMRGASSDIAAGLQQARTQKAVEIQTQSADLDALNAEYRDLPRDSLEFMPVTIEVAVTETESEKKLQLALAAIIGDNTGFVASSVGGVFSKDVSTSDLKLGPDTPDPPSLPQAKARYFDALLAVKNPPTGGAAPGAQSELQAAKRQYNEARHSVGLEALP